jgi:hypothetical protein
MLVWVVLVVAAEAVPESIRDPSIINVKNKIDLVNLF